MQVWLGARRRRRHAASSCSNRGTIEQNDFLARFVARHGAGPHHLTFKVPDLADALERVRGAGFHPVNIDISDPEWKEAFLMPREAHGTVVQLAESHGHPETRAELLDHVAEQRTEHAPALVGRSRAADRATATLRRVVLRTPSLPSALGFFAGVLQGDVERETADVGRSRVAARRARFGWSQRRREPGRRPARSRRARRAERTRHRHPLRPATLSVHASARRGGAFVAHEAAHRVVHGLVGERELHAARGDEREPARWHVARCAAGARRRDRARPRSRAGSTRPTPGARRDRR